MNISPLETLEVLVRILKYAHFLLKMSATQGWAALKLIKPVTQTRDRRPRSDSPACRGEGTGHPASTRLRRGWWRTCERWPYRTCREPERTRWPLSLGCLQIYYSTWIWQGAIGFRRSLASILSNTLNILICDTLFLISSLLGGAGTQSYNRKLVRSLKGLWY